MEKKASKQTVSAAEDGSKVKTLLSTSEKEKGSWERSKSGNAEIDESTQESTPDSSPLRKGRSCRKLLGKGKIGSRDKQRQAETSRDKQRRSGSARRS
jgi:hypothetical protein